MGAANIRAPSLSLRLGLSLLAVFAIGIIAAASFFYLDTHGNFEGVQARTLQEQGRELIRGFRIGPDGAPELRISATWQEVYERPESGYYYTIYDRQGRAIATSPNLRGRAPLPLTDGPPVGTTFGDLHFLGPNAAPALTARLQTGHFLVLAREAPDAEALAESLAEERTEPLLILLPFGVIAMILMVIVTRRTLHPVKLASAEAANIGPGNVAARIATRRLPAELLPLVEAFNAALDRMAEAYEVETRITANAAHELRTPLAVLSLRLQRSRLAESRIDWGAIEMDVARMTRLVSQLLDLARKEAAKAPAHTKINLARIAREAAADILPLVEASGRSLQVDAPRPLPILGNADDLRDLVRNLIENALIHGRGTIEIAARLVGDPNEPKAAISVSDEGEAMAEGEAEMLFERFRKGTTSSTGSGLGLAIVRQVARAHGGDAKFVPAKQTTIEVTLPLVHDAEP